MIPSLLFLVFIAFGLKEVQIFSKRLTHRHRFCLKTWQIPFVFYKDIYQVAIKIIWEQKSQKCLCSNAIELIHFVA